MKISRNYLIAALSAPVVFICGLLIGSASGSSFLKDKIFNAGQGFFFYKPASYYSDLYRLMNSADSLERLSAYYAVDPGSSGSTDFFIERLRSEELPAARKTLVWLLGYSVEKEKASRFLKELKDDKIKLEINRALRRLAEK